MLQKNFPRGLSPNSAAWRARTVPGGGKEQSVWNNGGFAKTPSLPSSRTVCVCLCVFEVRKSITDYLSLSLSLTCHSRLLLQTSTLQHGCAVLKLQMAHALHISSLHPPPPLPSSSHQLSRNKNLSVGKIVETEERGIEREGRPERTVTKQASLLPKINLLSTRGYYPIPSRA